MLLPRAGDAGRHSACCVVAQINFERKDRAVKTLLVLAGFAAILSLSAVTAADARKKLPAIIAGCTHQQILDALKTPAGAACRQSGNDSILNGGVDFVFVCTSSGIYCCPENASSAADCSRVSAKRRTGAVPLSTFLREGLPKK